MTSSSRKPARSSKTTNLDTPYTPGEPIPTPEVVEKTGDSAWALWNEIANQHEGRFADTRPATAPGSLNTEERGWARTAPVELPPREGAPRAPQPVVTIDAAMLVARRNNRVCPRPAHWQELHRLLVQGREGSDLPPAPATGPAWASTPALSKRLCFREQIEWADRHGALDTVMGFIIALPEPDWLHMGEG